MSDKAVKTRFLDKRTVERNIRTGLVTKDDYQNFISDLDDLKEQAEVIDFEASESSSQDNETQADESNKEENSADIQ